MSAGVPAVRLPHWHRMLLDAGWTDLDVEGLRSDWPQVTSGNFDAFALLADGLAGMRPHYLGGTAIRPEQVRAWLRALFVQQGRTTVASARIVAWVEGTTLRLGAMEAVWLYALAAGGDHDLGLLAFTLGIVNGDLSAMVQAGPVDPQALRVLAALNSPPQP